MMMECKVSMCVDSLKLIVFINYIYGLQHKDSHHKLKLNQRNVWSLAYKHVLHNANATLSLSIDQPIIIVSIVLYTYAAK